jgi:hypothetical protein
VQVLSRSFALLALAWTLPAFGGVQPGKWELTVEMSLARGADPSGPIVETRCISEAEARDPRKLLTENEHPGCVLSEMNDSGAEYTFSIDCRRGPVPARGTGRVSYTAQTLQGVVDLTLEQSNLRITTHSSVRGRRLGSCNS